MDENNARPAVAAFGRYAQAFQSLDAKAVATHFHEPALMITPQGVQALPNVAAVEQAYARVMSELPAQRYATTKFSPLAERRLSEDLALVTGSGSWIDTAGKPFMPFGLTYTFRRTGDSWRVVMAIIHSPEAR